MVEESCKVDSLFKINSMFLFEFIIIGVKLLLFIKENEFKFILLDDSIIICLFVSEPVNSYVPSEVIVTVFPDIENLFRDLQMKFELMLGI